MEIIEGRAFPRPLITQKEKVNPMKTKVNQDLCIGCELCTNLCPAVFRMNDDDKSEAYTNPVPAGEEPACRSAADSCPVGAISVTED